MPSRVIRLLQHSICWIVHLISGTTSALKIFHLNILSTEVSLAHTGSPPPQHISDLLCVYNPTRLLRSSGAALLTVLRIKSKCAEGAFTHYGPVPWNKLPADLRLVTSVHTFINRLKRFLFTQVYTQQLIMYVCVCVNLYFNSL